MKPDIKKPENSLPEGQDVVDYVAQTPELLARVLQTPQASSAVSILMKQSISHSGPLPMAEDMRHYNDIIPNGADRIMQLAEKEQTNRYSIPKWSLFLKGLGLCFGMLSVYLVVQFCFNLIEKSNTGTQ